MTKSEIRKKLKNAPKYPHEWNGFQAQKAETKPDRMTNLGVLDPDAAECAHDGNPQLP